MLSRCPRFLALAVLCIATAEPPPKRKGSPWLDPNAVKDVVEELVHHFRADGAQRKSPFVDRLTKRIYSYQEELRPIYMSLPKNEQGHVELAAVGQAMHYIFSRRYQMHLRGLASFGDTSGDEAPAVSVEKFVETAIQSGLTSNGFTNRELTVFAVAIEHLMHEETRGILERVFPLLGLKLDAPVPKDKVEEVLVSFVGFLMLRQDTSKDYDLNRLSLRAGRKRLETEQDPFWSRCMLEMPKMISAMPDTITFASILDVVEKFEQDLGTMHTEAICNPRKSNVSSVQGECDSDGLIPVSALRQFGFGGSTESLKSQGILAQTSPEHFYLANWMASEENCHIKTDFYTVCCVSECDLTLSKIEQNLGKPQMQSSDIAGISPLLNSMKSADELASHFRKLLGDAGSMDIHGTLFGKWLHFAAPCVCPFIPTTTTTTTPSIEQSTSRPRIERQAAKDLEPPVAELDGDDVTFLPESTQQQESRYAWKILLFLLALALVFVVFGRGIKKVKPGTLPFQDGAKYEKLV